MTAASPGRVVVTGAAGVLGSALVRELADRGVPVTGVDIRPVPPRPGVTAVTADIRDATGMAAAMDGAAAVLHCASALPSYPARDIRSIVVDGTRTVLTAAATAGVPRMVHISTTAVYGLPTLVPTPETHPRQPVDEYGRAKAVAEEIAESVRAAGHTVCILRPKTFVGPGRLGLFSMLFEWATEGRNFPAMGGGRVRTQMLGLEDLVRAILLVLETEPALVNDTFNIAAEQFGTLREDFQAVLDAAGHGGRVVAVPLRPAQFALRTLGRLGVSPVYGRLVSKLGSDSYVDTRKAADVLGFTPKFSNQEAILATYAWWLAAGRSAPTGEARRTGGRASTDAWRQGALALAKVCFRGTS